jgi:hypothetical protein
VLRDSSFWAMVEVLRTASIRDAIHQIGATWFERMNENCGGKALRPSASKRQQPKSESTRRGLKVQRPTRRPNG